MWVWSKSRSVCVLPCSIFFYRDVWLHAWVIGGLIKVSLQHLVRYCYVPERWLKGTIDRSQFWSCMSLCTARACSPSRGATETFSNCKISFVKGMISDGSIEHCPTEGKDGLLRFLFSRMRNHMTVPYFSISLHIRERSIPRYRWIIKLHERIEILSWPHYMLSTKVERESPLQDCASDISLLTKRPSNSACISDAPSAYMNLHVRSPSSSLLCQSLSNLLKPCTDTNKGNVSQFGPSRSALSWNID